MAGRVLVVDDEKMIVKGLKFSLMQDYSVVDCAYDGEEALEYAKNNEYDIILLDIMLPKLDGLSVCQQIREFSDVPIIMLTAKGDDMDKILGLEYGADDYITKPFNILEVKARMKAILRRNAVTEKKAAKSNIINAGDMKIDCDSRNLYIAGRPINLTAKEFDLLELLAVNPGKVYSRDNLLKAVWGQDYSGDGRTVDVHMRRLREKIEDNPSEPKYVHTKWGVGCCKIAVSIWRTHHFLHRRSFFVPDVRFAVMALLQSDSRLNLDFIQVSHLSFQCQSQNLRS